MKQIPCRSLMLARGLDQITPYLSDTLLTGDPDLVYRAGDGRELKEILAYCHHHRIPVTFSGRQTSLTGASVAFEGLLISMEKNDRILDIATDPATGLTTATAQPGILVGEFQKTVAQAGWYYPPDPTSRNEAALGGTVATNATGEDSLLYGPTRRYVRRLKILLADGREMELTRTRPYTGATKNKAGYVLEGDPIEAFIGSEGTLGLVTEVTVDLLPAPQDHLTGWAFFPDLMSGIEFVVLSQQHPGIQPRSLELIDSQSLAIIRKQERAPEIPERAGSVIVFKQEYSSLGDRDEKMGCWMGFLESVLRSHRAEGLMHATQVALDPSSQERFRALRHAIPSTINEEARKYGPDGGGKVSTDWWVPLGSLQKMMREVVEESEALGLPYYAFAHIGNGHPHMNYIARNRDEKRLAEELLVRQCRRAVAYGGGVAGEHGLGKIHRFLLPVQCQPPVIE